MKIRTVTISDAEQIRNIYDYYVKNTYVTFDCETPTVDEFRVKIENTLKRYPFLAACEKDEIFGYAYASPLKDRAAYDCSAEISIYVKHGITKRNIGTKLYTELEERLKRLNVKNLYSCIGHPNIPSEDFHKKMGFAKVARFRKCGFKHGEWLDVIWMEKFILPHDKNPTKFLEKE